VIHQDFDLTGITRFLLACIGASPARPSGGSSAVSSWTASFASTAVSWRDPAMRISS
jgi:hypothetical protein